MNFFKHIFSVTKRKKFNEKTNLIEVRRLIRFLGIKFSFKLYEYPNVSNSLEKLLEYYIYFSWQTLKDSKAGYYFERNIQNLELAAVFTKQKLPKLAYLAAVSLCIETKAYSKAKYHIYIYILKSMGRMIYANMEL